MPYARNTTSIAPTLVFTGTGAQQRPYLAVAAAGNAWITAAVYEVISGVMDGGLGPQRALELPRFLVGVRREPGASRRVLDIVVQTEDLIAPDVLRRLRERGHVFQPVSLRGELRLGFGAAALEQVLGSIESWGAEAILTGVSQFSEPVVEGLEVAHCILRKDLGEAIASAFQLADAQRHSL